MNKHGSDEEVAEHSQKQPPVVTSLQSGERSAKARPELQVAKKVRDKAVKEFKDWKKMLQEIIRTGSRMEWQKNGEYQFVLPSRLVRIVWSITVNERIKWHAAHGSANPRSDALSSLRDEIGQMADKFKESTSDSEQGRAGQADAGSGNGAGTGREQQDG